MNLLLDTCTFLWIAAGDARLSARCRAEFQSPQNTVLLSAVSCWEIAVKHALGRLALSRPPAVLVPALRDQHGIAALDLDEAAALHAALLPPLHRDPFDRMLVCQALVRGLVIATPDEDIARYGVRTLW